MDYRSQWQQRRRHEAHRRALWVAAIALGALGLTVALGRMDRGAPVWAREMHAEGPVYLAEAGGRLYCALTGGVVDALNTVTGVSLWPKPLKQPAGFWAAPACLGNRVLVASGGGTIAALATSSGQIAWEVETDAGIRCAPLAAAGVVYVGNDAGRVLALGVRDGVERWRFEAGSAVCSGFVSERGVLVFGTADGRVYGLNAATGRPAPWRGKTVPMPVCAQPVGIAGRVAIATDGGSIYLLDAWSGSLTAQSEIPRGGLIRAAPVSDGSTLFVGSTDGILAAYDLQAQGDKAVLGTKWVRRVGRGLSAGPALHDQYLYCGDGGTHVVAVNRETGQVRRRWELPARPQGTIIVSQGLVVAGTAQGHIVALRPPPS